MTTGEKSSVRDWVLLSGIRSKGEHLGGPERDVGLPLPPFTYLLSPSLVTGSRTGEEEKEVKRLRPSAVGGLTRLGVRLDVVQTVFERVGTA